MQNQLTVYLLFDEISCKLKIDRKEIGSGKVGRIGPNLLTSKKILNQDAFSEYIHTNERRKLTSFIRSLNSLHVQRKK